ncbi:MAG: bifunctional methylenetetrahydrofolate dehydrogenase/methenyltetrahydrofolate cyclohydrolase [Methanomicrobiales archaeon]|nr:bifunctional methylenetetrahydrofolate dehydrogenase/methenyltetrahydrofolate cyclohydrolase [Methanomicrobiales archaeon]
MILDGKQVAADRLEILKAEIRSSGLFPQLATVLMGDNPASRLYVKLKHEACGRVGIGSAGKVLPAGATTAEVVQAVEELNRDTAIDGILVQLPLPPQVATPLVLEAVDPGKDVDGFHPCNLGRLLAGSPLFVPATPRGILSLLGHYHIPVAGRHAVVVGRSVEVGRPLAALLTTADATVTLCHSKTRDLSAITRQAEILVSAVGRPRTITAPMVRKGAVVVDVGTNYVDGKLCGDVDYAGVSAVASAITPVPGGVGPMTIVSLLENTLRAARMRRCTPV